MDTPTNGVVQASSTVGLSLESAAFLGESHVHALSLGMNNWRNTNNDLHSLSNKWMAWSLER